MTTVILDDKTKKGKLILDLIREINGGKIINDEPNEETIKAIKEARNLDVKEVKDSEELINKLGI